MGDIEAITASPIISATIATIIGGGILEILRRRHRQKEKAREWYDEALGLLSNLQQVGRKATAYRDGVNYDTLNEQMSPLDRELMKLSNAAPKRVHESACVELAVIAAYATGLSSLSKNTAEMDALEFISQVKKEAIEKYDGDYDMDDLESMFSSFDFDEFVKEIDRDVSINEERADDIISKFSDESIEAGRPTTIKEALNIPIKEVQEAVENGRFLDNVVDDTLELFVNLVMGLGKDTHERMEMRKERI